MKAFFKIFITLALINVSANILSQDQITAKQQLIDQQLKENVFESCDFCRALFPSTQGMIKDILSPLSPSNKEVDKNVIKFFLNGSNLPNKDKEYLNTILEIIEVKNNYELAIIFWEHAIKHFHPFLSESKEAKGFYKSHLLYKILNLEGEIFGKKGCINFMQVAYGIEATSELSQSVGI
jgi:hypothetical protein